MGLEVGIVAGGIVAEAGCLHDVLQHTAHVAVDIGDVELAVLHTGDDLLHLLGLSWFHQVVAGMYLADGGQTVADANPVGHHDAFEAPVVAQDLCQQVVVAHRILAVDLVVGRHDGPRLALTDGYLEAAEVDFAGSTLADTLVDAGAVGLLRVHGEVLGADADTLLLYALDIGGGNLSREQRVFGIILEVAAAERVAVQVHARAEDDVAAVFLRLIADGLSHLAYQLGVPRRGQTGADGEGGGVVGLVRTLTGGIDAHAGRAVGKHGGRDAQTGNGGRCAGSSGHEVGLAAYNGCAAEEVVGAANQ